VSVLVDTAWVADHREDPRVRLIQADEDGLLYGLGHIPGAARLQWDTDLQSRGSRDLLGASEFAELMSRLGVSPDTTVVLYGDKMNGWATYAFWVLRYWSHPDVRLLDGGHAAWAREDRPLTHSEPVLRPMAYPLPQRQPAIRARRDDVARAVTKQDPAIVDARPAAQYAGAIFQAIGYPASGAHRGGHVPGARNVPWTTLCDSDGRFKSKAAIVELYSAAGVDLRQPVIAYCIIGVGSSYTYVVLHELYGLTEVRNYDGSWMEWGSSIGLPVELSDLERTEWR